LTRNLLICARTPLRDGSGVALCVMSEDAFIGVECSSRNINVVSSYALQCEANKFAAA